MEAKVSNNSKNNGFEGQFKDLNNDEMISLKGGVMSVPPIPPSGGADFPIPMSASGIQIPSIN